IFIASNNGELYALTPSGEIVWQTTLPAKPVGTPALSEKILYATDQAGLTAFDLEGNLLWRFEPEMGKAVAGPAIGLNGKIYYTLDISAQGYIQAVSPTGESIWASPVQTFSYFRTPQPTPDGQLMLFHGEAFLAADGSPVDLGFDFKPDRLFVGGDGQLYLLLQDTLARWTYNNGRAVMAEERVITSFGAPTEVGVTPEGAVWVMGRDLIAWFTPAGEGLTTSAADNVFLQVVPGVDGDWTVYACGRKPVSIAQSPEPYCFAFSPDSQQPLWEAKLNTKFEEFTGGVLLPDMLIMATEEGHLYLIKDTP
ncbi:MAG TPA: PQQ-binding-like beta-propeller repeat protein, partial [Anaerolineales bacterium]|nr:PQQ-binding-like beta-propeller repeat protein [Anaerolineales bacterium]